MRFEDELHRLEVELMAAFEQEIELVEERLDSLRQMLDALIRQRSALQEARTEEDRRFIRLLYS